MNSGIEQFQKAVVTEPEPKSPSKDFFEETITGLWEKRTGNKVPDDRKDNREEKRRFRNDGVNPGYNTSFNSKDILNPSSISLDINKKKKPDDSEDRRVMNEQNRAPTKEDKQPDEKDSGMENKTSEEAEVIDTTHISCGAILNGTLSATGAVDIAGRVVGDVKSESDVDISGEVQGDIEGNNISIKGKNAHVVGNIIGISGVSVGESSVLVGDIISRSAKINGAVKGSLDISDDVVLGETAIVFGNVKAESIDIKKGAVIKGNCTLNFSNKSFEDFFHKYETLPGLPVSDDTEVGSDEKITPIERVDGEIVGKHQAGF